MKQILQNLKSGQTTLTDVPAPVQTPGKVLIRTRRSLISAGTERMLVEFGKSSLVAKAKSQPDKVKQVLDKIKAEGVLPTLEAVFKRLDEPLPLGYCNSGIVADTSETGDRRPETGKNTKLSAVRRQPSPFQPGDRVISNGPHAEFVSVPYNLCAKIPDGVTDEEAAFTVLASIGLQGIRLIEPQLGEKVVVYGLGLIGLITVQILKANGCDVLGIDINEKRLALAESFGAAVLDASAGNDPVIAAQTWSGGEGVDAVLITASSSTNDIVHQSARMCRKRGKIVLVGVVGLDLQRADFYEKEITFQVSCSYGPGRYDERYEQAGQDYPYGFVRWTEQRNFQAVLAMLQAGTLNVKPLISHRIPFADAPRAYDLLSKDKDALGVILEYASDDSVLAGSMIETAPAKPIKAGAQIIGIIGAGNFSKMTLLPALSNTGACIKGIADLKGEAAAHLARKYNAKQALTDYRVLLDDPTVRAVFISTGHHSHARMIVESLQAGKDVFVEKPLALNTAELGDVLRASKEINGRASTDDRTNFEKTELKNLRTSELETGKTLTLMVGFNRRFSPHIQAVKRRIRNRIEPLAMTMTVNAGMIPKDHWVHDPKRGGGRIIGEACHFMDLMVHLTGSRIKSVSSTMMRGTPVEDDKMAILLHFEDGSIGTINYFANGAKSYPKEILEVFYEGRVIRMDNFKRTSGWGFPVFRTIRTMRPAKGHAQEMAAFIDLLKQGGRPLIPLAELVNVTLAGFAAMTSAAERRVITISGEYSDTLSLL